MFCVRKTHLSVGYSQDNSIEDDIACQTEVIKSAIENTIIPALGLETKKMYVIASCLDILRNALIVWR